MTSQTKTDILTTVLDDSNWDEFKGAVEAAVSDEVQVFTHDFSLARIDRFNEAFGQLVNGLANDGDAVAHVADKVSQRIRLC